MVSLVVVDVVDRQSVPEFFLGDAAQLTGVPIALADTGFQRECEARGVLCSGHAAEPSRVLLAPKPLRRGHLNVRASHTRPHFLGLGCAPLRRPVRPHHSAVLRTLLSDLPVTAAPLLVRRHSGARFRCSLVAGLDRSVRAVARRATLHFTGDIDAALDTSPLLRQLRHR